MREAEDPEWKEIADEIEACSEALMVCALRFDGYKYWQHRCDAFGVDASDMTPLGQRSYRTLELFEDDFDNLAAFFILQRFLGNGGGESCTPWSEQHRLYRFFFLHCYRLEIPQVFRMEEYCTQWDRQFRSDREQWASRLRRSFQTKGHGPESWR